jgi:hypothetical protein
VIPISAPPRLLISVRNGSEARAAMDGGAEIVDVKEPARGSLGAVDAEQLTGVVSALSGTAIPVSVACGEVVDGGGRLAKLHLPPQVVYAKLGLAGMGDDDRWVARWLAIRSRIERCHEGRLAWIGVIYADQARAASPVAVDVIRAAADTGCRGVLVDTFSKDQGRLLDWLSVGELSLLRDRAQLQGLLFAVAGRLQLGDVVKLSDVRPDVLAFRSAACCGGARTASIDRVRVARLRRALSRQRLREPTAHPSIAAQ